MTITTTLSENPLLLLFTVASLGFFLGSIKIRGSSLGVAAVLFTGLFFGAVDSALKVPDIVFILGLVLFVYSIGLSSGPAFFKSYKKNGLRDFGFVMSMLIFSGLIALFLFWAFGFSAATIAGIYSGSTTNTPALAGVIDHITNSYSEGGDGMINAAVIGYSLSYPMGVLGGIISIIVMEKVLSIDYDKEKKALRKEYPLDTELSSATILVTNERLDGQTIRDVIKEHNWDIVFGRIIRGKETGLTKWHSKLKVGDILMIVGNEDDINDAVDDIGIKTSSHLEYDMTQFDVRRIFVSNVDVVGRTIASLNLDKRFHAVVTRIRRGDIDMLATDDFVLELGDRIRFVARRQDLRDLSNFFGDSYADSSKVNLFSFGLGIGIGLLLGMIQIPLGPTFSFKLGYAGGPLIVGLILGALRRTGPIVWTLPYSANVTLQQIGLILLLAGIGVNSGSSFASSLSLDSIWIIISSVVITLLTGCSILLIGYKIVKLPFSILMGMVSNQPAILDFAMSKSKNKLPEFGYTMMFPIASIMKIVIAQLMFIALVS